MGWPAPEQREPEPQAASRTALARVQRPAALRERFQAQVRPEAASFQQPVASPGRLQAQASRAASERFPQPAAVSAPFRERQEQPVAAEPSSRRLRERFPQPSCAQGGCRPEARHGPYGQTL